MKKQFIFPSFLSPKCQYWMINQTPQKLSYAYVRRTLNRRQKDWQYRVASLLFRESRKSRFTDWADLNLDGFRRFSCLFVCLSLSVCKGGRNKRQKLKRHSGYGDRVTLSMASCLFWDRQGEYKKQTTFQFWSSFPYSLQTLVLLGSPRRRRRPGPYRRHRHFVRRLDGGRY